MMKLRSEIDESEVYNKKHKLDRIQIKNCETNESEFVYVIISSFGMDESYSFSLEGKARCAISLMFITQRSSIMAILQSLLPMPSH
jgi:hypothetical protein